MEIIQTYMQEYSYIGIFLIIFLEYSNFPIPSEIVLPMVGVLVISGYVGFFEALIVSVIAGLTGSLLNYFLGKYIGDPLIRKIIKNNAKLKKSLTESIKWIDKYGKISVLISRVIPLIRTMISIPAGVVKMPLLSFIIYSGVGILIWNTILISSGAFFAENIDKFIVLLERYSLAAGVVVGIGIIYIIILKQIKSKKSKKI